VAAMLKAEYSALLSETKAPYVARGRMASLKRKHGQHNKRGESSFGIARKRNVRANAEHALRMALFRRHQGKPPEAIPLALAEISTEIFSLVDGFLCQGIPYRSGSRAEPQTTAA